MKFVTVATREDARLNCLRRSCVHFGIDLVELGAGQPYAGHGAKVRFLSAYCRTLPADETVLYTDGYDSFFVRSPAGLEETFRSLRHPLVFSAEQRFFYLDPGKFRLWLRYPRGQPPFRRYRFLNGGGFIARAGYCAALFESLGMTATTVDDQTVFGRHLVLQPGSIELDRQHRIFTGTGGREGIEERDFSVEHGTLKNLQTDTAPYLIHFPGYNWKPYDSIAREFPFLGPLPALTPDDHRRYLCARRNHLRSEITGLDNYGQDLLEYSLKALGGIAAVGLAWWSFA